MNSWLSKRASSFRQRCFAFLTAKVTYLAQARYDRADSRIAGSKLNDSPKPLRFYYIGNVFRYEEP